jgi:hypothetical protein
VEQPLYLMRQGGGAGRAIALKTLRESTARADGQIFASRNRIMRIPKLNNSS